MRKAIAIAVIVLALSMVAGVAWFLFLGGESGGGGTQIASLSAVFNDVQTRRARQLSFDSASKGEPLYARDSVKTGSESRAVVTYDNGLVLNVDPESLITVTPQNDSASQEIVVERGSVAGSVKKGFSAPKHITFRSTSGAAIATLTPQATGGEAVEYRVNVVQGKATSISVLKGAASIERAGQKISVKGGENYDLATGEAVQLPLSPKLEAPDMDAALDLSSGDGNVELRWGDGDRAARYHVQVANDPGFADMVADQVLPPGAKSFKVKPGSTGLQVWRVASVDAKGREGEFSFGRRFSVTALPGQKPVEVKPPEPVIVIEAFKVTARAQGQLQRAAKGSKEFHRLAGPFTLRDGDVVKSEGAGSVSLKGSAIELAAGSQALFASAKADKSGKRKDVVMKLEAGAVTADLSRAGEVASLNVAARSTSVKVKATDRASRARAEILPSGQVRVTVERGAAVVSAGGKDVAVTEGKAVDVTGAAVGDVVALPGAPSLTEPRDKFSIPYQDSPPHIAFAWKPVAGAAHYRFVVASGAKLQNQIGSYVTDKPAFELNTLRGGSYTWAVYAQDATGHESLAPAMRTLEIQQDRTAPVLTLSAPCEASSNNADQKYCSYTAEEAQVEIVGKSSKNDVNLKIEGKPVSIAADGSFKAKVDVTPGMRFYSVEASDKAKNYSVVQVRIRKD